MSSFKLESNSKFQLPDIQESTPSESLGTQHTDVFLFDFSGTEINTPAIFRTSFRRSNPGDMQLLGARDNMPLRGQKSGQGRNARDMPTTRLTIAVGRRILLSLHHGKATYLRTDSIPHAQDAMPPLIPSRMK
jgi:hypothetical protein